MGMSHRRSISTDQDGDMTTTAEFHEMEAGSPETTVTVVKDHPLAIRWLHWINVPFLMIMTWSGLMLAWANESHEFGLFGRTVTVFPEGFYQALGVRRRLAEGLSWHLTLAWLFTLNGLLYFIYLTVARQWGHLLPRRGAIRDSIRVILHDLHLRKEAPPTDGYNAAQRIAYTLVVELGAIAVLTGLAIAKSARFSLLTTIFGGYHFAKLIHFSASIAFAVFVFIHVLQVAKAGWQNFRSMIVGHKIVKGTK
jgi:thiosulfate reductase cytochrome b subunit